MNLSIVPITYLICLAFFLTPLAIIIISQIFKFYQNQLYLNKDKINVKNRSLSVSKSYEIANIYIKNQKWHLALMLLENNIHQLDLLDNQWSAKYHNAAGFILQKLNFLNLASRYYQKSSSLDPTYIYAERNLKSLKK